MPSGEAERFIGEIEDQFQNLYRDYQKPEDSSIPFDACPHPSPTPLEKWISVADKTIQFSFGDRTIEQFIFPMFSHLEVLPDSSPHDLQLEVFSCKGNLYLIKNQEGASKWLTSHAYKLKGALLLDVINLIHHTSEENWMGVIHASSVSQGNGAQGSSTGGAIGNQGGRGHGRNDLYRSSACS